jgi:hypothetical protein
MLLEPPSRPGGLTTPFVLTDIAALVSGGVTGLVAK